MSDKKDIGITQKCIEGAMGLHLGLTEDQAKQIAKLIADKFMEEIEQGLEGNIDYSDAPFFEAVDKMYEESQPKGCYFCDRSIDGNETPFDYPNETRLCLTCMLKVANLMKAFGIDPQSLFPGLGDRNIQKVIYAEPPQVKRPEDVSIH